MAGSEALAVLLPFISWSTLPQLMSKMLLKAVYEFQIIRKPATPIQAQLHARRAQALVILGYLLYTVYATVYNRSANFYEILGVSLDSDVEDIRRAFRKLARIYHPDKAGGRAKDQLFFIELRRAHDCLTNPVQRIAYDRFGFGVLGKTDLITERDYFSHGLQNSLAFYVIHPISYGFFNWIAGRKAITYWLLTLYIILLASEISLIFRGVSHASPLMALLPSTTTAHDMIASLHSAYTALILASAHLGPLLPTLRDPNTNLAMNHLFDGATSEKDLSDLRDLIAQQEMRSADLRVQSGRNLDMILLPLRPAAKTTVPTLQHAANEAAKRRARASTHGPPSPVVLRQPSKVEQAFIYRLGQSILRHRLEVVPAVRDALKKRSADNQQSRPKQTAAAEGKGNASEAPEVKKALGEENTSPTKGEKADVRVK